jgi:hypothetical protein
VTLQGLLLRNHSKLHPLFNGSGSEEQVKRPLYEPIYSFISSQRAMFDTFTRHAGSGLVHPTDGQIQRLLLREPSSHSSRPSRPSSAHRSLPPHSNANNHSSEDDEFESFLSQQQQQQQQSAAWGDSSSTARARPASALSQGRPGEPLTQNPRSVCFSSCRDVR